MDSMSYRNNRPGPRPSEPEPAAATPAQANVPPAQPVVANRPARAGRPDEKRSKKPLKLILIGLLLVVAAIAAWYILSKSSGTVSAIDSSKYQAVVLKDSINTPTYFGKLSVINDEYMRLTNVYYLKKKADSSSVSTDAIEKQDASDFELIKLGNEIHGPEDEIIISVNQVLYFENLKPTGTVSKTITDFQKNKN